ncbi:MAG: hypothetical protein AAF171_25655 [Cyanobacteria bacterium P01_A01_bin.116]
MTASTLSFDGLLGTLDESIESLSDPRKPSNGRLYILSDAMLGAFSAEMHKGKKYSPHNGTM